MNSQQAAKRSKRHSAYFAQASCCCRQHRFQKLKDIEAVVLEQQSIQDWFPPSITHRNSKPDPLQLSSNTAQQFCFFSFLLLFFLMTGEVQPQPSPNHSSFPESHLPDSQKETSYFLALCHAKLSHTDSHCIHLKRTEVLREVLKQNIDYKSLACYLLCSLTSSFSMFISKSCNIRIICNFRCNILLGIFFGISLSQGFASLEECIWSFLTMCIRISFFLQGNSVLFSTHMLAR